MNNDIKEEWRSIPDYEEHYQVSDLGRVRRTPSGNILKPFYKGRGYHYVSLSKNNVQKQVRIHRMVTIAFLPNPENKSSVNHINGIKDDNRLINLEWCTDSENMIHACNSGLVSLRQGESHGSSKLKESDVLNIRKLLTEGVTGAMLAKRYNVTQGQISHIKNRRSWTHI